MHTDETQNDQGGAGSDLNPESPLGTTEQRVSDESNAKSGADASQQNKRIFARLREHPDNIKMSLLFDFLLIIITSVYAVFAALQWTTLRRQANGIEAQVTAMRDQVDRMTQSIEQTQTLIAQQKEALDYARRSATAAETSVDTTQTGVDISGQSMRFGQAAYITIQEAAVEPFKEGEKLKVRVRSVNAGNTPAYNLRTSWHVRALKDPLPVPLPLLKNPIAEGSRGIVGPRVAMDIYAVGNSPLTKDDVRLIEQNTVRIYVWGIFRYSDIFKNERWTTFCFVQNANDPLKLDACPHGNEAK